MKEINNEPCLKCKKDSDNDALWPGIGFLCKNCGKEFYKFSDRMLTDYEEKLFLDFIRDNNVEAT